MLGELEQLQARFDVQGGALGEQSGQRVVLAPGEPSQRVQLDELGFTFSADDARQLVATSAGAGDQLEVKIVAVTGGGGRGRAEPLVQRGPSRVGDGVNEPVRPPRLGLGTDDLDVAVALEAVEHLVQVADVQRAPLRADTALERALELIAVTLTVGEQRYRVDDEQAITALDGVSLDVAEASAVALSGPSGSGKSTLLHVIAALERPDEGSVTVGGRELRAMSRRDLAAHRRRVGFVFQRFNLLPALTVIDNVMAPVLPFRVGFDKEARARGLLEAVGLEGRETSLPSRLSGGQQ
ncbi:MAG TPA: ATP-binding cassette domain-containing protein [Solirubrobacter sp.]|nr:ATP-binding cassette domain-containing protein [Solirubrobacter sp.]